MAADNISSFKDIEKILKFLYFNTQKPAIYHPKPWRNNLLICLGISAFGDLFFFLI